MYHENILIASCHHPERKLYEHVSKWEVGRAWNFLDASTWLVQRAAMGVSKKPTTGDRGPVRDALLDVIDAAGGLEFSRGEFLRVIGIAQEEYSSLFPGVDRTVPHYSAARHLAEE